MFVVELFGWWYGRGWQATIQSIPRTLKSIYEAFSVPVLVRTLFDPWKRIISYPGASLDTKLRAFADNLVSRAIGFVVRFFVLCTACMVSVIAVVLGVLYFVIWPLIPLCIVILLAKGIIG